ncbi:MAG: LamG-like jellyroll fold domain-containing protein [Micavibrio sp.]
MTKRLGAILVFMFMLMTAQPVWAACSAPAGNAGDVVYNGTEKTFQYCNDTNWIAMNQPGSGAGGCTNPSANEGDILYNQDHRVLQGCVGNVHKAMGPVEGGDEWEMVSVGNIHTCGIKKSDGTAWCWGASHWSSGTYGKIGHGSTGEVRTPTKVDTSNTTGSRWIYISAGEGHSCGVRDNNTGWCWGSETEGRLGNSSTSGTETIPVAVSGGHSWAMISAGGAGFSCGVRTDGAGYCWGLNTNGRLGIGGSLGSTFSTPQAIAGGYTWKSISTGGNNHACGIISNDDGYCWGAEQYGKLGNGASGGGSITSPAAVTGGHKWQTIKAGNSHTCGITLAGAGYCWGDNGGKLGDGTSTQRTSPTVISGGATWIDIAPLGDNTCGIQSSGQAYCWGWGYWAELGNYTWNQSTPSPIYGPNTWRAISASNDASVICATRTQGDLYCWGNAAGSGISNGSAFGNNTTGNSPIPVKVADNADWLSITAGGEHSCGVKTDNTGWCWGSPANGRLGNENPYNGHHHSIPRPVSGSYSWSFISAGDAHTCGIQTDGTGWCWGIGSGGQVGDNGATQRHAPTAIDLATNSVTGSSWIMIDTGSSGTNCGIRNDNTAWCWGWGSDGRLGDGDTSNNLAPNIVSGGGSWSNISVGASHACGVQTNGTGWCWGNNGNGRLGDGGGAAAQQTTPFQVSGGFTWTKISASDQHSCGIRTDGVLMCWGEGDNGRLGTGNSTDVNVPTSISGGGTWIDVWAGLASTCALKSDNTIWCWGSASNGALGNNQRFGSFNTPQPITGGGKWTSLHSSEDTTCAINQNGESWCWGASDGGMLGDGKARITHLPQASWCSNPDGKPGAIVFNSTEGVLQYCDGVSWTGAGGAGAKKTVLPSSGLVGYWKFDASSGTAVADSSGNGNHGTMINMDGGTDWVTGRFGNGLDFDGVDDYVNVNAAASINDLTTRTVCAWVYPRAGGTGTYKHITYKYDSSGQTGWDMYYSGSAQSQGGVGYIEPSGQVTNNQWQHFCVTSDGVNLEGYKNGVNTTPGGNDGGWGSAGSDAAYNLIIGGGTGSDAGDPFYGIIDELRIYNRVLTLEEIQTLANQ